MAKNNSIYRSIGFTRFQSKRRNLEKLMVIVDEEHLDMLDEMMIEKKWSVQVSYILTDSPVVSQMFPRHSRIYPLSANIRNILRFDIIDEIVCCTKSLTNGYVNNLAEISEQFGVSLLIQPYMQCTKLPVSGVRDVADYFFLTLDTNPRKRFTYTMKSTLEIVSASFALILLSPLLFLISAMIKFTSPGPVMFKQVRVGLRGRKFYIFKFRTMVVNAEQLKYSLKELNETDGPAFKIKDDPRITSFGKMLRKTGLDEIPQLYNVVRGEMALIGPRPMLPVEVLEQEEWQLKRMCIKPGITCTWQIQPERNTVPFDEWMKLDREYIENWSIGNDIRILLGTVKTIFMARGA